MGPPRNRSGSAFGGHYYAYIRSFEDGKWYKFNDSTVTGATWDEVGPHESIHVKIFTSQ